MEALFSSPLSPDELYWCGLIHADGSINRDRLSVRLGQKDVFVIEEFLKFLGQDSKISKLDRETNFGRGVAYVATSGVKHRDSVRRLLDLGIKGEICDELYASRHFWRGLIDGDGGIYRVGKAQLPFVSLCSGKGPRDVEAYSRWVGKLFGYSGPRPYLDKKGVWYANIGASKARLLAPYLYRDGYSAVHRKRDLALSFAEISSNFKICFAAQD